MAGIYSYRCMREIIIIIIIIIILMLLLVTPTDIAKPKAACALRFSWAATSSNLVL